MSVKASEFSSAVKHAESLFPGFYFDTMLAATGGKFSICIIHQQDFTYEDMQEAFSNTELLKKFKSKFDSTLLQQDAVKYELKQKDEEIERLKAVELALVSKLSEYQDYATYFKMHQAMLHNKQVIEVPAK